MWSIVPFKVLTRAKQRLSGILTDEERAGLSLAMVQDVLTALQQVRLLDGIIFVSGDTTAAMLARQFSVEIINEHMFHSEGLNSAASCAVDLLRSRSIENTMIIHSDLPLASTADITSLVKQHQNDPRPSMTLVPDRWNTGTNCLLSSFTRGLPLGFGPASLSKHKQTAQEQGISVKILDIPSLAFDVDTPADLLDLINRLNILDNSVACFTRSFLRGIDEARLHKYLSASGDTVTKVPEEALL